MCEHDWHYTKDSKYEAGKFETVEREVKCSLCNKIGREVWIFSTVVED